MSTIFSFKSKENQHDVYRAKDCMKTFYELLMRSLVLKRKKMKLFTKEQQESYENTKMCYICHEKFEKKHAKDENIVNLGTIVIKQGDKEVLHIEYVIESIVYLKKFL